MFDKLKQLAKLKEIQSKLKQEFVTSEREGVKVTINGELAVEEIVLNPELAPEEQAQILKELLNEAAKKIQDKIKDQFVGLM